MAHSFAASRLKLAQQFAHVAFTAGGAIMAIYSQPFDVEIKADKSPVTEADKVAEQLILDRLAHLAPDLPVVAEEAAAAGHIPDFGARFVLVDPLDGTREFIDRNGEFTVNIALIEDRLPVAGVVFAPARSRLFFGAAGSGAFEVAVATTGELDLDAARPISVRSIPADGLTLAVSRSHGSPAVDDLLRGTVVAGRISAGSSLKFCLVAAGEADLYPRLGRTMEWDTAAGHAVLSAAGGSVVTLEGDQLTYGKRERGLDNPHFLARGWQDGGLLAPQ